MPETTNDQWIFGLEKLILAMTEELCDAKHVVEISPYINEIEEKEENNHDFYRPFDTKGIEDVHLYFMIEAALATM